MAKVDNIEVTEERIKVFAVSFKYKEKPFFATGIYDDKTKVMLTGQNNLTPTQLKDEELIINPNEHYLVRNNDELVLKKKGDVYVRNKALILYELYKVQPNFAHSKGEVIKGMHDFYLQNFEAEANFKIINSKNKAKASAKILDLSLSDMTNLLYYFGENASLLSNKRAEAKVFEIAEADPKGIILYFDDLDNNQKIVFVKKLLSKGLIKRADGNGYLMYNKIMLGANEIEAAAFLYNNANESIYLPLKDMLEKSL